MLKTRLLDEDQAENRRLLTEILRIFSTIEMKQAVGQPISDEESMFLDEIVATVPEDIASKPIDFTPEYKDDMREFIERAISDDAARRYAYSLFGIELN